MRVLALLVCVSAACASSPPRRNEVDVPNRPPPAPPPPPAVPAPELAQKIIDAQTTSYADVTPAFEPVRADLMSGNDRLVAEALEVVEAIGNRVTEMAAKCPPENMEGHMCGLGYIDHLTLEIDSDLVWLLRKGGCATEVAAERAAKQFRRLPRFQRNPKALLDQVELSQFPQPPPSDPLPVRVFVCGMVAVRPKVAACYAQHRVPGTVMLHLVIGKNGTVTTAVAQGQFAGTPTGTCVEAAARTATFPPSDGLSTPYPFVLPPPAPKPASLK